MVQSDTMEAAKNVHKRVKLLVTIVNRGKGGSVVELLKREYVMYNLSLMGRGTAKSHILDYLGLGETEKDIILSVVLEERLGRVLDVLGEELKLDTPGKGIAFTIPISSVGGPMTLQFISGMFDMLYDYSKKRSEGLG